MEDILKHDWYKILGCAIGDTKEQISKAARKLALKYHPDKNSTQAASAIFLQIQKAKEVLLDETARTDYDNALKKVVKRKEYDEKRKGTMDATKKRMREDLEERMKKATTAATAPKYDSQSSSAAKKTRAESIHEIRKANIAKMESHAEDLWRMEDEIRRQKSDAMKQQNNERSTQQQINPFSLKVKWRKHEISHSEDSLVSIFREFGSIESVQLGGSKGTSAIIVFSDASSVQAALDGMFDSSTFKVSRVDEPKRADIFSHVYDNTGRNSNVRPGHVRADLNVEEPSSLMSHVRRAVEREELLRGLNTNVSSENNAEGKAEMEKPPVFSFPASRLSPFAVPALNSSGSSATSLKDKENETLKKMREAAALRKVKPS